MSSRASSEATSPTLPHPPTTHTTLPFPVLGGGGGSGEGSSFLYVRDTLKCAAKKKRENAR